MNEGPLRSPTVPAAAPQSAPTSLHVAGLGWSGSSAAFEYLREHAAVETVSAGRDGETCTSVKQVNPVDFSARHPRVEIGPADVVHLLTGGRFLSSDTSGRQFGRTTSGHSDPNPLVRDHLAAHPRYSRMNQDVLVGVDEGRMLDLVGQRIGGSAAPWSHTTTRWVLQSLAATEWPDARYLMFNNDPWLPSIITDDLTGDSVFVIVVRRAESQFADFANRQMMAKRLRIPGRRALRKWLRNALRARRHLRSLMREAERRDVPFHVIRFEDFVSDIDVRLRLTAALRLRAPDSTSLDFAQSQRNIRIRATMPIPWWLRSAFPLLDLLLPRTTV